MSGEGQVLLRTSLTLNDGGTKDARKHNIPVVTHVITDVDLGIIHEDMLKFTDLSKVIKLMEDPASFNLTGKHLKYLKRVTEYCQYGIPLIDLVHVFQILNLCAEKVKDQNEYLQPMCGIIKLCGLPFLKQKSSDEGHYSQIVSESISQLGYLMRLPLSEVRIQICESIISFYTRQPSKMHIEGFQPTSTKYNAKMVEQSGVSETLVLSLVFLENEHHVKLKVLQALQCLSSTSDVNCNLMLKAQAASRICSRLNDPDPTGQLLFRSSEILWNLLEHGSKQEIINQLSNLDCIQAMKEVFVNQLLHGYRHYDRQLRNDLLVIATLVAANPGAPMVESGFCKLLILFSTFSEVKSHNPLVRSLKLSYNNEDFEMKKLLFNMLVVSSKDLSALQLMCDGRVILALFHYVKPNEKPGVREWSAAHFEELQLHALAALATLAPLLTDDYMTCQGNTRLLLLLEWCISQDPYFGHGNSFHGSSGRGSKHAQMRYCLRLLRSMLSQGEETVNQDFCDQGGMDQLLGIINSMLRSSEEEDAVTVEMQTDILLTLSSLCENDLHKKELFGSVGVELLIRLLKVDSAKFHSGLGHNQLILATVDCIWCCIIGCYSSEDYFLEKEGIFLLLDLLASTSQNMRNLILGTLLEFCDNPKSISHISTWRGKKDQSAAKFMVQLWKEEEKEMQVKRDKDGRIVGFEDFPGLSAEDYVTVAVISRYLDFKVGEIWKEIAIELNAEEMRPVTPDQEALETILKTSKDVGRDVASLQAEILDSQQQQDFQDEKQMYAEIRANYKQRELAAKSWENYVARTSNYEALLAAAKFQEQSIESSKPKGRQQDALFHTVNIAGLHTTSFCGRTVAVESTPAYLTGGPLARTNLADEKISIRGGALQKNHAAKGINRFKISTVAVN
ncbi:cilia- and flagella-associated protein 69 isoform X2 [Protopterus annectens]|uniref:cilia- and flagella-associated protein 69 isoform X2 n=1 Tax=Protopterus annectens TaxID=7888 RepID=UPI001CF94083|nr:cilia- and flagella-associated protein 69 isoform X2 [Protopterus annectens]